MSTTVPPDVALKLMRAVMALSPFACLTIEHAWIATFRPFEDTVRVTIRVAVFGESVDVSCDLSDGLMGNADTLGHVVRESILDSVSESYVRHGYHLNRPRD